MRTLAEYESALKKHGEHCSICLSRNRYRRLFGDGTRGLLCRRCFGLLSAIAFDCVLATRIAVYLAVPKVHEDDENDEEKHTVAPVAAPSVAPIVAPFVTLTAAQSTKE